MFRFGLSCGRTCVSAGESTCSCAGLLFAGHTRRLQVRAVCRQIGSRPECLPHRLRSFCCEKPVGFAVRTRKGDGADIDGPRGGPYRLNRVHFHNRNYLGLVPNAANPSSEPSLSSPPRASPQVAVIVGVTVVPSPQQRFGTQPMAWKNGKVGSPRSHAPRGNVILRRSSVV